MKLGQCVALVGLCVLLAARAEALVLPAIVDVHPAVAAARPDLLTLHDAIVRERKTLLGDAASLAARCKNLVEGSPADIVCVQDLDALTEVAKQHCGTTIAFTQAYLDALPAVLVNTAAEKKRASGRLLALRDQFLRQASSFEAWGKDAEKGYDETYKKIQELSLVAIGGALNALTDKIIDARIDRMMAKATSLKEVRYVKKEELKTFIEGFRNDLKNTAPAQAKEYVLAKLRSEKLHVGAITDVADKFVEVRAKDVVNENAVTFDTVMESTYGGIIAGTQVAIGYGVAEVQILSRAQVALGVLGLAPQAMEASFLLWEASVQGANIDAMETLQRLAEQQRVEASQTLKYVVQEQKELEALRPTLQKLSQFQCQ